MSQMFLLQYKQHKSSLKINVFSVRTAGKDVDDSLVIKTQNLKQNCESILSDICLFWKLVHDAGKNVSNQPAEIKFYKKTVSEFLSEKRHLPFLIPPFKYIPFWTKILQKWLLIFFDNLFWWTKKQKFHFSHNVNILKNGFLDSKCFQWESRKYFHKFFFSGFWNSNKPHRTIWTLISSNTMWNNIKNWC